MKYIERLQKRLTTKDAEISKKEEIASAIAVLTRRGDGKFGRSRSKIEFLKGRGGSGDQRSSTTFCERRSRVSSDAASDRRVASRVGPFQIEGGRRWNRGRH